MKIETQEQFNRVVTHALGNLYALHLNPEAVIADPYGTKDAGELLRAQMADLDAYAYPQEEAVPVGPEPVSPLG